MIQGRFGENGQIYFEIDLISNNGLNLPVEAMLATGFTEFLAINKQDVESLGWSFLSQDKLRTAQGEATFDIYLCKPATPGKSTVTTSPGRNVTVQLPPHQKKL